MSDKLQKLKTFTNGFLRENPLLVLNIGLCSSLGVTGICSASLSFAVGVSHMTSRPGVKSGSNPVHRTAAMPRKIVK